MVLRVNNLEIKSGLVFDRTSTPIFCKQQSVALIQKKGIIPTQINSQVLKLLFCDFWRMFAIWGNGATIVRLRLGFTPTNTCPTKNSKVDI